MHARACLIENTRVTRLSANEFAAVQHQL